jgi:hypothetical protein
VIALPKGFVPDEPPAAGGDFPPGFVPDGGAGPAWLREDAADRAGRVPAAGLPKWSDYVKANPTDKGAASAFAQGAQQGAMFGFGDEFWGATQAMPGKGSRMEGFGDRYKSKRDEARAELHEAEAQHPIATTLGQIAGGAVTAPLALPLKGGGFAVNAAQGAFTGVLAGAGASEADSVTGVVQDAARGGLAGAAVAGGASVAGKALWSKLAGGAEGRIDDRIVQDITGGRATRAGKKVYQNEDLVIEAAKKFNLGPAADDPAALAAATETARKDIGAKLGEAYRQIGEDTLGARTRDVVKAVKAVRAEYGAPSEAAIRNQIDSYLEEVADRWGAGARDRLGSGEIVEKASRKAGAPPIRTQPEIPGRIAERADRVSLRRLNDEIGNLEKVGFKGADLSDAAGATLKRDLAGALENVLQERLEEIKDLGGKIAKSSLAGREGFSGLAKSAEAAQLLPSLNRDYRGLKLIGTMANERSALPPASRAAGGLRNAVGNAVDMGLLFTHPVAFAGKKLGETAAPALARGADKVLAGLYAAAQAGQVTAQMLQQAIEAGVPRGLVERFAASAVSGSPGSP